MILLYHQGYYIRESSRSLGDEWRTLKPVLTWRSKSDKSDYRRHRSRRCRRRIVKEVKEEKNRESSFHRIAWITMISTTVQTIHRRFSLFMKLMYIHIRTSATTVYAIRSYKEIYSMYYKRNAHIVYANENRYLRVKRARHTGKLHPSILLPSLHSHRRWYES